MKKIVPLILIFLIPILTFSVFVKEDPLEDTISVIGTNISIESNYAWSATIRIDSFTNDTTIDDADELIIWNAGSSAARNITYANFYGDLDGTSMTLTNKTIDADNNTVSNIGSTEMTDNSVQSVDLEATNSESDNDIVTVDTTSGGFTFNSGPELCEAITGSADLCDGSDDGSGGGGGGSVAGSDTYVQYNLSGTFGAEAGLAYDYTNDALAVTGSLGVTGTLDVVQFMVTGNSTQTNSLAIFQNSAGTDAFTLSNGGNAVFAGSVSASSFTADPSATPSTTYTDSDTTDEDVSTQILTNCTDTGSGTEDCDLTISQQIAGALTDILKLDADGNIEFTGSIDIGNDICSGLGNGGALVTNASGVIVCEADDGGGSSSQYVSISPSSMFVTGTLATVGDATQGASIDGSNGGVLLFDATTDEGAGYRFRLADNWASHGDLRLMYSMQSGVANEVEWEAAIMCQTAGDSERDDADGFAAIAVAADTVPGTKFFPDTVTITLTDDSCAAGDLMTIFISTDADDATNDDATGDRRLLGIVYKYTTS